MDKPNIAYQTGREGFSFRLNEPQKWGFREIKGKAQLRPQDEGIQIDWNIAGTAISKTITGLFQETGQAKSLDEAKRNIEATVEEFVNRKSVQDYMRLTEELTEQQRKTQMAPKTKRRLWK